MEDYSERIWMLVFNQCKLEQLRKFKLLPLSSNAKSAIERCEERYTQVQRYFRLASGKPRPRPETVLKFCREAEQAGFDFESTDFRSWWLGTHSFTSIGICYLAIRCRRGTSASSPLPTFDIIAFQEQSHKVYRTSLDPPFSKLIPDSRLKSSVISEILWNSQTYFIVVSYIDSENSFSVLSLEIDPFIYECQYNNLDPLRLCQYSLVIPVNVNPKKIISVFSSKGTFIYLRQSISYLCSLIQYSDFSYEIYFRQLDLDSRSFLLIKSGDGNLRMWFRYFESFRVYNHHSPLSFLFYVSHVENPHNLEKTTLVVSHNIPIYWD